MVWKKKKLWSEQTCNSDELFHEIGMVRLQPEVISCTEWTVLIVLVWDGVLATDVVVCVVWVNGNGDVPIYKTKSKHFSRKKTTTNIKQQKQAGTAEKKSGVRMVAILLKNDRECEWMLKMLLPLVCRELGEALTVVVFVVVDFGGE